MRKLLFKLLPVLCACVCVNANASEEPVFAPPSFVTPSTIVEEPDQVDDTETRLQLSRILLYKDETLKEAGEHLKQLIEKDPNNAKALFIYARYLLRIQSFTEGNDILNRLRILNLNDPLDALDLAGLEAEYGYAIRSRSLFEQLRCQDVGDETELFEVNYAKAAELWGDWSLSSSILAPLVEKENASIANLLNWGTLLIRSQKLDEAEQLYRCLMEKSPESPALFELVALKLQEKDYEAALCILGEANAQQREKPLYALLQATIASKIHLYSEAEALYLKLADSTDFEIHRSLYLTKAGEAALKDGECSRAYDYFLAAYALNPLAVKPRYYLALLEDTLQDTIELLLMSDASPQERSEWAANLVEDGYIEAALIVYDQTTQLFPEYFSAWWDKGNLLAMRFQYQASADTYAALNITFPNSLMISLQYARVRSWAKEFDQALCLYDALIAEDPEHPQFLFEKARVALWAHEPELSRRTYWQLIGDTSTLCLDEEPCLNELADWRIRKTAYLEMQAKFAAWNNLALEAIYDYELLLAFLPNNEEALFEYAQLYQILGVCNRSAEVYAQILDLDPNHNIAQLAMGRIDYELSPRVADYYTLWCEKGYGGLSEITRHKIITKYQAACDCQTKGAVFDVLFSDHPYYIGGSYVANGIGVEYTQVFNEYAAFQGSFTEKVASSYHLKHRSLAEVQFNYRISDTILTAIGYDKKDEFYNVFGIQQDIQSNAAWLKLAWSATRKLQFDAVYRWLQYSDHNHLNYGVASLYYQFTEHPRIVRCTLQAEYRNTAHLDVFIYSGSTLVNIIHPYWCPQNYWAGRGILEWYHDLSELDFAGSEKHYYTLRLLYGNDTDNNHATACGFDWHLDWDNRWSCQVSGLAHYSPMWKAVGLWTQLSYAF